MKENQGEIGSIWENWKIKPWVSFSLLEIDSVRETDWRGWYVDLRSDSFLFGGIGEFDGTSWEGTGGGTSFGRQ